MRSNAVPMLGIATSSHDLKGFSGYYETSAKTAENVQELFADVVRQWRIARELSGKARQRKVLLPCSKKNDSDLAGDEQRFGIEPVTSVELGEEGAVRKCFCHEITLTLAGGTTR